MSAPPGQNGRAAAGGVATLDVIVFGAGVAGLWLANTLQAQGFRVCVIESDAIGAGQSLASQGMIHGGQRYALQGHLTAHANVSAQMPALWEKHLAGECAPDLRGVKRLSEQQYLWPAGTLFDRAAVWAAAQMVNAQTRSIRGEDLPLALRQNGIKSAAQLPELVLDMASLMRALAAPLAGRLLAAPEGGCDWSADGEVRLPGLTLRASLLLFAAGLGNEGALAKILGTRAVAQHSQRRALRQILVRRMAAPLFGHAVTASPKPRITVTSHLLTPGDPSAGYVWYLGGALTEAVLPMQPEAALRHAQSEMRALMPAEDWNAKEWALCDVIRAEPLDAQGRLPDAPRILPLSERVWAAWPVKMTFLPLLAEQLQQQLAASGIVPNAAAAQPLPELAALPAAPLGSLPWQKAQWRTLGA